MERICKICQKLKNTPYKDICRNCYQKKWVKTIPEKCCEECDKSFSGCGTICVSCKSNKRNRQTRSISCVNCKRSGLIIRNKTLGLCVKCYRQKLENEDPSRAKKRRDYLMKYSRRKKGTDLDAPRRESKGWWKTSTGYILIYKPDHPNANCNGCVFQHVYVMSESIGRSVKKQETVHHINGQRDDNRIENLELWSCSHPYGQRVEDKIEWAKFFLEQYGFDVKLK